jgi:hypothetical protein
MKKVVLVLAFLGSSFALFSQADKTVSEKRMKYGFNFGVSHSNLLHHNTLPDNATLSNNPGFRLGILAEYQINKFLSVSPKSEISFNNSSVKFSHFDGSATEYNVMPISLDLMAHVVFKKSNEKLSPYFFFGPDVKIPVSNGDKSSTAFPTRTDFAFDFGIGMDKAFKQFNFAPELRYSFGILNVNQNPALKTLNFHTISLVFNFRG